MSSTLLETFQAHLSRVPSWPRAIKRFHRSLDGAPRTHRIHRVEAAVGLSLKPRILGLLEAGAIGDLVGCVLVEQLERPEWASTTVQNLSVAAATCFVNLDGVDLSKRALDTLKERLREAHQPDDMPLYPMLRGLCGIYFGFDDIWQAEADVPWSDAYVFVSGRTFGGNVKGLMTYLGAARLNEASFTDVEPALLNFIGLYDGLRDAGFVYFEHLVLAGIIAGHRIGGVPRAEALDWFGRYLCWAVGLDEDKPALPTADGLS